MEDESAATAEKVKKKVRKVKKKVVEDELTSGNLEPLDVADTSGSSASKTITAPKNIESDSSSSTTTTTVTKTIIEGDTAGEEGPATTKTTKKVIRKKIIKTEAGGDDADGTTVITTTTKTIVGGDGEIDGTAAKPLACEANLDSSVITKVTPVSHDVTSETAPDTATEAASVESEIAPKKKVKKKKVVVTESESAGDASEATHKVKVSKEVPLEKDISSESSTKIIEAAESKKETKEIPAAEADEKAAERSEDVIKDDHEAGTMQEVKKKNILKKKVVHHAEEEVSHEPSEASQKEEELKEGVSVVSSAAVTHEKKDIPKPVENAPDASAAIAAISVEKLTEEGAIKVSKKQAEQVSIVTTVSAVKRVEDDAEAQADVSRKDEVDKAIVKEEEVNKAIIKSKEHVDTTVEHKGTPPVEEQEVTIGKQEIISKDADKAIFGVDVEGKIKPQTAIEEDGMDDTIGVIKSSIVKSEIESDIESDLLNDSKKRARNLKLDLAKPSILESEILIEAERMARDLGKILLSPSMLSMKTLVAREEKLQSDLRCIRQCYGNLDTEVEYIRSELNQKRGQLHHPSTLVSASSSIGSTSFKPTTARLIF